MKVWIRLGFAREFVVGMALLAACDKGGSAAGASTDGAQIYQSLCATCHGSDGKPPAAMTARLAVRDLSSSEFRTRASIGLVEEQVRSGSKNRLMPAFAGALSEDQIKAVAAYVMSQEFPK